MTGARNVQYLFGELHESRERPQGCDPVHTQLTSPTSVLNSPHSAQRFFAFWTPIAWQRWPRLSPLSGSPRVS